MLTFQPGGLHQCMEETGGSVIYTQEMTSGWPTRLNSTLHSLVYLFFFPELQLYGLLCPQFSLHTIKTLIKNNFHFSMESIVSGESIITCQLCYQLENYSLDKVANTHI